MIVILCDIDDIGALWLQARLRATGEHSMLVTADMLAFARRRTQRVGSDGIRSTVELGDGAVIENAELVVNRLMSAPDAAWRWARPSERDYATAELTAFTLSWLAGLDGPVRNRPDPACLAGPAPHPLVAAVAAARAGMDVPDAAFGTERSPHPLLESALRAGGAPARVVHVVALDGRIVDPVGVETRAAQALPARLEAAIPAFAAAVGAAQALIGIDLVCAGETWWFAGMTPLPDLAVAGDALVRDLVALTAPVPA